ncbi:MAG TPA: 5,10-methylenetetrahydrofolate reductase, partial [Atribacterota bacterium]|nr:5,10-methylenetetrahydrofolate reductase [Atribacterota bacterium]
PERIRSRMANAGIEEGIRIAQELSIEISTIKEAAGIHFFPMNKLSIIPQLIINNSDNRSALPVL